MNLKEKLLSLGCFEDNEYLDFYLQIVNEELLTPSGEENHHIIPRCYYRYNNLEVDNSDENLVKLSHFKHCLCHYYLCLCLKGQLKYKSEHAFIKMVKIKNRFEFDFELFLEQASLYDKLYEDFIYNQRIRGKSNKGNKNKHCYTNDLEIIYDYECPEGYWPTATRKGRQASKETRQRMSLSAFERSQDSSYINKLKEGLKEYYRENPGVTANRTWISNGIDEKLVDLNVYYLEEGWYIGRSSSSKLRNRYYCEKGRKIYDENKKTK